MTSYEPSVRCFQAPGEGPISEDCYQILDSMPARKNRQIFGPAGTPGVTVGLPYELHAGMWSNTSSGCLAYDFKALTIADIWVSCTRLRRHSRYSWSNRNLVMVWDLGGDGRN